MKEILKYNWVHGEKYVQRIYDFLMAIDETMIPVLSDRVNLKEYANKLARQADTIFVTYNSLDVGSCSIYCNTQTAFISSIAVKSECLYQGIGTQMMEHIKAHVMKKQCNVIQLEVYYSNQIAISYYKKNGFREISRRNAWIFMEYRLT